MLPRSLRVWRASLLPSRYRCKPLTRPLNRIFEILMAVDGLRARNIIQLAGIAREFSQFHWATVPLDDPW